MMRNVALIVLFSFFLISCESQDATSSAEAGSGNNGYALPASWPQLDDPAFPYHAEFRDINDGKLVVEFYNYSTDTISWFKIDYALYGSGGDLLDENTFNQSSYPYFLGPMSNKTEELPFPINDKTAYAKIDLVEIQVTE